MSSVRTPRTGWVLLRATIAAAVTVLTVPGSAGAAWAAAPWSAPANIDGSNLLWSVSCPSSTFCGAVGDGGNVLTWDGASWSSPTILDSGEVNFVSVSCTSSSFCVAVGSGGHETTWNGFSWSAVTSIDSGVYLNSVSCASGRFCVAVDGDGYAVTLTGATWSPRRAIDNGAYLNSVSCASSSFCVAVDADGYGVTLSGATWSLRSEIDTSGNLTSVSCPRSNFCVAVGYAGNEVVWDGATWAGPDNIDLSAGLNSVSCVVSSFCAAVDTDGAALTGYGGSWSAPVDADTSAQMESVSCADSSFCVAVDGNGNYLRYPVPTPPGYQITGFGASRPARHWRAGTAHDITATIVTPGGDPLPAGAAATIAGHCWLVLTGTGAQHLGHACLGYDGRTGRFTYEWHLLLHVHGAEYLRLQLTFPSPAVARATVTITGPARHPRRAASRAQVKPGSSSSGGLALVTTATKLRGPAWLAGDIRRLGRWL